jgi:hypothetical protein
MVLPSWIAWPGGLPCPWTPGAGGRWTPWHAERPPGASDGASEVGLCEPRDEPRPYGWSGSTRHAAIRAAAFAPDPVLPTTGRLSALIDVGAGVRRPGPLGQKTTPWLNRETLSRPLATAPYRSRSIRGTRWSATALLTAGVVGAGGVEPPALPCQQNTGNRCARRRSPRSAPTVGPQGKRSLYVKGNALFRHFDAAAATRSSLVRTCNSWSTLEFPHVTPACSAVLRRHSCCPGPASLIVRAATTAARCEPTSCSVAIPFGA